VPELWVGIPGDLRAEQAEALTSAEIAVDDLLVIAAGRFGGELKTVRTLVRVWAVDESEAKGEAARVIGFDAGDLIVYSPKMFR
jgi:hypothetical protein